MGEFNAERAPRQQLTTESHWQEPGLSHQQLVTGFKDYIRQHQEIYGRIRRPKERGVIPPQEILRKKLDIQSGSINPQEGEFFSTLRYAWDALAYDFYEPGTAAEELAGATLNMYYQHYRAIGEPNPTIKLTPGQTRIIDALAEAAGLPLQKGQHEIEIDERHRNRNKWIMSKEYEERVANAAARARGENPEQVTLENEKKGNSHLPAEQDPFYEAFWESVIERSSLSPMGTDPAYWPATVLFEFEDLVNNRKYIKDKKRAALADKLAPMQASIRRMRMAFEVIAYPHVRSESAREAIERQLQLDSEINNRDQIELNDAEAKIVGELCATPRYSLYDKTKTLQPSIPFDPKQRVYPYSEVFHPSKSLPEALGGAEFIAHQARAAEATEIDGGN